MGIACQVRSIMEGWLAVYRQRLTVPPAMNNGRGPHIAVPRFLFGQDGKAVLRPSLEHPIEAVQLPGIMHHCGKGVWHGLLHFPYPFLGHMGRTKDQVEGFVVSSCALVCQQSGRCGGNGNRPDLCFAGAALGHDESHLAALQLAFDGFSHRQLGVVEGVSRMGFNVAVDVQHLRGEGFGGGIKEGDKQLLDPLCHGNAEGVEVFRDAVDLVQRVQPGLGTRNGDRRAFERAG